MISPVDRGFITGQDRRKYTADAAPTSRWRSNVAAGGGRLGSTLEEVVDHYIEFFKVVRANAVPGAPIPPIATTDGVHFDRRPTPDERAALIAYLRKL